MSTTQIELRPISTIIRKHARASQSVGTFSMTEGYELCRTCFTEMALVIWHSDRHGSSFNAEIRAESVLKGQEALNKMQHDLEANGYTATRCDNGLQMQLEVRVAQ